MTDNSFNIILITPEVDHPHEKEVIKAYLKQCDGFVHIRKPEINKNSLMGYLAVFNSDELRRMTLHQYQDLAMQIPIGGVHWRESDRLQQDWESKLEKFHQVRQSISIHRIDDTSIQKYAWDYMIYSPVYESISKPGYGPGKEDLSAGMNYESVIALGGITPDKYLELQEKGFSGAALLGYVWQSDDPLAMVESCIHSLKRLNYTDVQDQ